MLEALIDESKVSVRSGIGRLHIIINGMCQDILQSMKNLGGDHAISVGTLEGDVGQLMFLLLRLVRCTVISPFIARQLNLDALDCLDCQTLIHRMGRIADHATTIANSLITLIGSKFNMPKTVKSTLIKSAETAFATYDLAVQGYLSKDLARVNGLIDNEKLIRKYYRERQYYREITPLLNFNEIDESSLFHLITLRERILRISHLTGDIAELTIDCVYKSVENNSESSFSR